MKSSKFLSLIGLLISIQSFAAPIEDGKSLFTTRCAGCHNVNKLTTGPALGGVEQRHSLDWIVNFIQSSQSVIKNGDTAAIALFEKFNKLVMPDHKDLTKEDIQQILNYIKAEYKPGEESSAPFAKPGKLVTYHRPLTLKDKGFFAMYLLLVAALVFSLLLAVHARNLARDRQRFLSKDDEEMLTRRA